MEHLFVSSLLASLLASLLLVSSSDSLSNFSVSLLAGPLASSHAGKVREKLTWMTIPQQAFHLSFLSLPSLSVSFPPVFLSLSRFVFTQTSSDIDLELKELM